MLGRILCLFKRHRPDRTSVMWNGFRYTAQCKHCGKPIHRRQGGGWHVTTPGMFDDAPRSAGADASRT